MPLCVTTCRAKNLITTALIAPILVPEVVLAVALLLFLNWLGIGKSFALLLAGHVIFTLPFVILVVQARLVSIRRDVEEAALSLGASPVQTFFSVTLPLLMPAVAAGALFAFTISFDDITGTLFWETRRGRDGADADLLDAAQFDQPGNQRAGHGDDPSHRGPSSAGGRNRPQPLNKTRQIEPPSTNQGETVMDNTKRYERLLERFRTATWTGAIFWV